MIKAIIVEDEPTAIDALKEEIATYCPDIYIVATCDSFVEAIQAIDQLKPDLVFMDIQLGDGTGFQVMEHTAWKGYKTIVTTAYDNYAIKAFKTDAVGYLLKPVNGLELLSAVKKALGPITKETTPVHATAPAKLTGNRIAVQLSKGILLIDTDTILRVEAEGNYSRLYCTGNEKHLSAKTLKDFEDILVSFGFIRVHHAHLINMAHIKRIITKDGMYAEMSDWESIPVSQRKRAQVLALIESIKV